MKNNYFTLIMAAVFVCLMTGFTAVSGQAYSKISLGWNTEMGCSVYDNEGYFHIEELDDLPCLQICEGAEVLYWVNDLPPGAIVEWTVIGGTYVPQSGNSILVTWIGSHPTSTVYIEVTLDDGTLLEFQVCVEMVGNPIAGINLPPPGETSFCVGQEIFFINTSIPNPGGQLVDFHWDFGIDEPETSNEFEPSYIYSDPGTYTVTLTVWNECRCSDTYELEIHIEEMGEPVDIECPTVTCEGAIEMYSANPDIEGCDENVHYNWIVEGGTILNGTENDPVVEVLWDNVDDTGFGWVTLYLEGCNQCPVPSTVKVPVVKSNQVIKPGVEEEVEILCKGSQYRFYMPQWPTTEFEWSLFDSNGVDYSHFLALTDQRNEIIINLRLPTAAALANGEYKLHTTYYNTLKGCTGKAERIFYIYDAPHVIMGPTKSCEGENLLFETAEVDPQTYWILEDDNNSVVQSHIGSTFTVNVPAGIYMLRASAPYRCAGPSLVLNVYAYPPTPVGDFTLPDGVCPGESYVIEFTNTDPDLNPNQYILNWEVENGEVEGHNTGPQINVIFDDNPTGDYKVSVSYSRKGTPSCPSDWLESEIINPVNVDTVIEGYDPQTDLPISYNQFCTSTTSHFRVDEIEGDEYIWKVTPSNFGSVIEGQGTNQIEIMWNEIANNVTFGDVELKIRKCTEWFTVQPFEAELIESPDITLSVPSQVCAEELFDVTVYSSVPITNWTLFELNLAPNTTPISNPTTVSPTEFVFEDVSFPPVFSGNVLFNIEVTIETPNGCMSDSFGHEQITVIPSPVAIITPNINTNAFCNLTDLQTAGLLLTGIEQTGLIQVNSWTWYHSQTSNGPYSVVGNNTAFHQVQNFGFYKVEGIGTNGCSTMSDPFQVIEDCGGGSGPNPGNPCPTESLSLTTVWLSCNRIEATVNYTSSPIISWYASPSHKINLVSSTGNTALFQVRDPGKYTITVYATYSCGRIFTHETETVYYQPKMDYEVECLPNGDYAVTLYNDSPFIAGNAPDHTAFYHNGTPVNYPGINQDEHTFVVSPGYHEFQLEISKTGYPVCSTYILPLDLTPPDASFTLPAFACAGDNGYGDVLLLQPDNPNQNHYYKWEFSETSNLNMDTPVVLFTEYGNPQYITLTVTDRYGCTDTHTVPIEIILPDFQGNIVGHENPVCQGDTVTLSYIINGDTPISYQWLFEEMVIPGATGSTYAAGIKGRYGLLVSDNYGCFQSIDPVNVNIIPEPIVRISGPESACAKENFTLYGSSNKSSYARRWLRNGVQIHPLSPTTPWDITMTENSPGTYTYTLEVGDPTLGECTNELDFVIEIMPEPNPQQAEMGFRVSCNPFMVMAYIQNPDPNGTYNWSNGDFGTQTTVNHSGLIGVRYTTEWGCSIWSSEIIPKLPEEHLWVFPTGCVEICESAEWNPQSYVIGPLPIYDSHDWVWNGNPYNPQYNSVVQPQELYMDGTLQMQLGTNIFNTYCDITSDPLNISYAHEGCRTCESEEVWIEPFDEPRINQNSPFLYYDMFFQLSNNHGMPLTFQLSSPDGVFVPSTFLVHPGQMVVYPQFFPNSGFTGGTTTVFVRVLHNGVFFCEFELDIDFPYPVAEKMSFVPMELSLSPNPAIHEVLVSYEMEEGQRGTLTVYSLSGIALIHKEVQVHKDMVPLNIDRLSSGMYIIVLKDTTGKIMQQILIKR